MGYKTNIVKSVWVELLSEDGSLVGGETLTNASALNVEIAESVSPADDEIEILLANSTRNNTSVNPQFARLNGIAKVTVGI